MEVESGASEFEATITTSIPHKSGREWKIPNYHRRNRLTDSTFRSKKSPPDLIGQLLDPNTCKICLKGHVTSFIINLPELYPDLNDFIIAMSNLLSLPFRLPRLPHLILSVLLIRTTLCLSLRCWSLPHSIQPPRPSDCGYILTHLPFIDQDLNLNSSMNAHTPVDLSSPFFPIADIHHGSCAMRFTAFNTTGRRHIASPGLVRMTEPSTLEMWGRMRDAARNVITVCVDHLRVGSTTSVVNTLAYRGLAYEVSIHSRIHTVLGWRSVGVDDLDQDPHSEWRNRFARPQYEV